MTFMMHVDANELTRDDVMRVETPAPTATHYPVPHGLMLQHLDRHLADSGIQVVEERHALAGDKGQRYFGCLYLQSENNESRTVIGLRNAHDKTFGQGLVCGLNVFVCDNLSFSGEIKMNRKHTRHIRRDLPHMLSRCMGQLADVRAFQEKRVEAYKSASITDKDAHDLLIRSVDCRAIAPTKLPAVIQEWREPSYEDFSERNVWSLFNAFTEVYKSQNVDLTRRRSQALHGLLDSHLSLVA